MESLLTLVGTRCGASAPRNVWWVTSVLVFALVSCSGPDSAAVSIGICGPVDPGAGFTVRDSSGVRITENLTPADDQPVFRVGEEPIAVVGAREADADDVIGQLAAAVLLGDGRIVLADGLTREIRVHAPDGSFLLRFGGDGSGPGEFSRSVALFRGPGDTLVIAHEFGLRYARMLPDGRYLDGRYVTAAPGEAPVYHTLLGVFGDGDFLVAERRVLTVGSSEPVTEVTRRGQVAHRLHRGTGALDSIGPLPGDDSFTFVQTGELEGAFTFGPLPAGRVENWALGREEIFFGWGDHFEIERRSGTGSLTGLFRACEDPQPLDPAVVRRMIDEHVAGFEGRSAEYERAALEGIPHPTVEPAHLEMIVDASGQLWVRDFGPDWEVRRWRVFDEEGRWLGSVTLPARSRLLDVRTDRLLIAGTDGLGVEHVHVYGLVR